jgi:hypothetical protein
MSAPTQSPWGQVQSSTAIGTTGIYKVETSEHGGLFVPNDLLETMPAALRTNVYGRGNWFEEDCEWALVALAFPAQFTAKQLGFARLTIEPYAKGGCYETAAKWLAAN